MLSNFQLETHALLQSFLIGQPEFRATLQGPEMEQLRQRVIAACHIGPLSEDETRGYIEHRLGCVGWSGSPEFRSDAYRAIYHASGGIPRRINSLCDRLLWYGYLAEKKSFSASDVADVDAEMNDESPSSRGPKPARSNSKALESPATTIESGELERMPANFRMQGAAYDVAEGDNNLLREQLKQVEMGLRRLDASMMRMERNSLATTTLLRRLLEAKQNRDPSEG